MIDNSNTQFAVLALWVSRRHDMPTDDALRRAERYFRANHVNGTWRYQPGQNDIDHPSMTCAGLLGIAIGAGVQREAKARPKSDSKAGTPPVARDPLRDPLVQVALRHVGAEIVQTVGYGLGPDMSHVRDYYFLWSVERVAVVYGLSLISGRDWYQIGSALLLRYQRPDGLWVGRYSAGIDSCFALLFLRKANFAHDLTAALRHKPTQTTLKAGGNDPSEVPAPEPNEAEQLARELKSASPARQEQILEQLRDRKGAEYTEALAKVVPQLAGEVQRKARDMLAERMARMSATTLRTNLRSDNPEIRRASALACAMREEKTLIPDLIAALDDQDTWVIRAAAVALRTLTGEDFGPAANATSEERSKAVAAWKAWWRRQKGR
jgi:hypothetical protein